MTNFLLTAIVIVLACMVWGTGLVLGTIGAFIFILTVLALFVRALLYIKNGQ